MTMILGNRLLGLVALGVLAQWKDGEQLRYWIAFWLYVIPVCFLDSLMYLEVYEGSTKRWGKFVWEMFILLPLSVISLMKCKK